MSIVGRNGYLEEGSIIGPSAPGHVYSARLRVSCRCCAAARRALVQIRDSVALGLNRKERDPGMVLSMGAVHHIYERQIYLNEFKI